MIFHRSVERDSSIIRDFLRALSTINVDEDNEGRLIVQCFKFMKTDIHAVAVRYISLEILENACKAWPELSHELLPILKDQQNTGTDRYWIACQKAIKRLDS